MSAWSRRRRGCRTGWGTGCGSGGGPGEGWSDLSRLHAGLGPWRRIPGDGLLAGVCAGLARAVGVQPLLVRLGFVAAGLASGPFAVLAYVVLAAVLPVETPAPPGAERRETGEWDAAGERERAAAARPETVSAAQELAALRARLQDCDRRAAELERRVVAENFDLDRAIRGLEK